MKTVQMTVQPKHLYRSVGGRDKTAQTAVVATFPAVQGTVQRPVCTVLCTTPFPKGGTAVQAGHPEWAHRLRRREQMLERLTSTQRLMLRAALRPAK